VFTSVTSIIFFPIYIFAAPVLKFLGQQKDMADPPGSFTILECVWFGIEVVKREIDKREYRKRERGEK